MKRIFQYLNSFFFAISILLVFGFIYLQITNDLFMPVETLSIVLVSLSIVFKYYNFMKAEFCLFVILIILLFIKINLSYTIENGNTSVTYHSGQFPNLFFNPIVFISLILFVSINIKAILDVFHILKYGSKQEQMKDFLKKVDFYYNMFSVCSPKEFDNIYLNNNEYPSEAQEAILKIKLERKNK